MKFFKGGKKAPPDKKMAFTKKVTFFDANHILKKKSEKNNYEKNAGNF